MRSSRSSAPAEWARSTARAISSLTHPHICTLYDVGSSPDGRWLAFISSRVLYKIPREGGTPIRLSDSFGGGLGLDWYGDTIFVTRGFAGGIWAIPADGGKGRRPPDGAKTATEFQLVMNWFEDLKRRVPNSH
jgi:hypothetical protein